MSWGPTKKELDRLSPIPRATLVRNREAGEALRPPKPIKCPECCDMPWRRVDHLCRPGRCFGCGLPHEEEMNR